MRLGGGSHDSLPFLWMGLGGGFCLSEVDLLDPPWPPPPRPPLVLGEPLFAPPLPRDDAAAEEFSMCLSGSWKFPEDVASG